MLLDNPMSLTSPNAASSASNISILYKSKANFQLAVTNSAYVKQPAGKHNQITNWTKRTSSKEINYIVPSEFAVQPTQIDN